MTLRNIPEEQRSQLYQGGSLNLTPGYVLYTAIMQDFSLFSDTQHSVYTFHHFEEHSKIITYLTDDT